METYSYGAKTMPIFTYQGVTLTGTAVSGEIKAKDPKEVEELLRNQKIILTSAAKKRLTIDLAGTIRRVKTTEVTRFTRQFAVMLNAGLPMVECLDIATQQCESRDLKRVLYHVKESVQTGSTLTEALRNHRKHFDDLYLHMVEAGETSGTLDTILNRIASYREKRDALLRKVKAALVYPAIVLAVAMAVTIIMLTYIVPIFVNMFQGIEAQLPLPTKIVVSASNFFSDYFLVIALIVLLLFLALRAFFHTDKGKLWKDKSLLKLPAVGNLIRKSAVARFSRTLGTLISSGVAILEALEITSRTAGNRVIEKTVKNASLAIAEGKTITQPLKDSEIFPPMVTQMIAVGERTGELDTMLDKIAVLYEEEVDTAVAGLTAVLEPVIIVIMGIIIGGILIAMYLPMFEIIGKIG
jgi:type IV pilus assembly protein PilC